MELSDRTKLPLSFVAEMTYCPRSAYYLLVDAPRSRGENEYIVDGRNVHAVVDDGYERHKRGKRILSDVWIHSEAHHLSGKVDVIEFPDDADEVIPVEFKRGGDRINHTHEIQLALMGLCLREMYPELKVDQAAIYFTQDKQRHDVALTPALFDEAAEVAADIWRRTEGELIPRYFPAVLDARCQGCCFYDLCHED